MTAKNLEQLNRRIIACRRCPRLIDHCRKIGTEKRASYRDWDYWAKPVPNFGDLSSLSGRRGSHIREAATGLGAARLLILGLAPAAHGANRTGRMFTGDRSGDLLYRTMYRSGFANQPTSQHADDGLVLCDALITAACHCAPPANKPTREELHNCGPWLEQTFDLLANLKLVLCLGKIAMDATLRFYKEKRWIDSMSHFPFSHGTEHRIEGAATILCSYHPSQQNTFTGRLTESMLMDVFLRARQIVADGKDFD